MSMTDLNGGPLFNAEFGEKYWQHPPEKSGVALSFCRRRLRTK
ncbi:hypothetical protein [Halothiobacillus sp.]|nr:hypothetical protein [Halothiobacillus sp.]